MDKIARDYGVVAINVNYRLGALGFLADEKLLSEYGASGGANGVVDQVAALKWVQENIERFGGDPEDVTIFGER
jgi:para-nitrobenzyl esterase